jgi:hypothetical protein
MSDAHTDGQSGESLAADGETRESDASVLNADQARREAVRDCLPVSF